MKTQPSQSSTNANHAPIHTASEVEQSNGNSDSGVPNQVDTPNSVMSTDQRAADSQSSPLSNSQDLTINQLFDSSSEPGIDQESVADSFDLTGFIQQELQAEMNTTGKRLEGVAARIAKEVDRICRNSDRIQTSGEVETWQQTLARHRLQKCLTYHRLGSRRGRVELHSNLSAMVYRHVAPTRSQLGFQGRYNLLEDFLQTFYIEVLKAFRRENELPEDYTPRTQLELAEYMAFTEHYARRRINLPGYGNQQLIVLRAQAFARRQPAEAVVDIELAMESARGEEEESYGRSSALKQLREQMVADVHDPTDSVLRDRVLNELIQYLEEQGQSECIDYLVLKLQDLSVPEIDSILNLTPRQRDYLQQRFKYHVEKFSRSHNWQLVHQWLGADLDENLGLSSQRWQVFMTRLSPEQQQLLQLKRSRMEDRAIAKTLKCTPKQVQSRWYKVLELAWQTRNQGQDR